MPETSSLVERFQRFNRYRMIDYGHPMARYVLAGMIAGSTALWSVHSIDYAATLARSNADQSIRHDYERCARETRSNNNLTTPPSATTIDAVCPPRDRDAYTRRSTMNLGMAAWMALMTGIAVFGFRKATAEETETENSRLRARQDTKEALAKPKEEAAPVAKEPPEPK
jgi:hypothetical protein